MSEARSPFRRCEKIGDCTLYLGDCRDILPTIGKVDAVVTDPPYGINISSNPVRQAHNKSDWDAERPHKDLISHLLAHSKTQIIWGGNYFDLPGSRGFYVWNKVQPENFSLAMCEMAWTNMDTNAKIFTHRVTGYDKQHPTQKPIALMTWCIKKLPDETRTILDPFMGSGTTGISCAMMGKTFIGIEREESYFDIACRRIEEAQKQPDMFVSQASPPMPRNVDMFLREIR